MGFWVWVLGCGVSGLGFRAAGLVSVFWSLGPSLERPAKKGNMMAVLGSIRETPPSRTSLLFFNTLGLEMGDTKVCEP